MFESFQSGTVVEHDGRLYDALSLMRQLSAEHLQIIADFNPRSAQEAWDLVTRSWPAMADSFASRAKR